MDSARGIEVRAGELRAICLCCFGRGGSNIVWNIIGASPEVLMTAREWHQMAFAGAHGARRALRRANRAGWLRGGFGPLTGPLGRLAARRALEGVVAGQTCAKPDARFVALKLMDHNIWRLPLIERGFAGVAPVVFARDPLAQCEGLMRSGLAVEDAAAWYADAAAAMIHVRDAYGARVFRFEDLAADPDDFAAALCAHLGVRAPQAYRVKRKRIGADRGPGEGDMSRAETEEIAAGALRDFVEPGVNDRAVARLSGDDRAVIARRAGAAARELGYDL